MPVSRGVKQPPRLWLSVAFVRGFFGGDVTACVDKLFRPFDLDQAVIEYRRYLPHWNCPDCTYFITFRCADSLPQSKLEVLYEEKKDWMRLHPKP
jgi:hypothetical protein